MHLRSILYSSAILLGSSSFTGGSSDCAIKYNGIYTASVDEETDAHIRFYEDGVVIVSTSVKNIKDVNTWSTKENIDRVLKGKFKVKRCGSKFTVKGDTGEQQFFIRISGSAIQAEIKDIKTKRSTTRIYSFIPL